MKKFLFYNSMEHQYIFSHFAFLDDHSRLIPHAQFYLTEWLNNYQEVLRQALLKRGLPRKLYVGNGPAFRSQHLAQITASLGIALIHSQELAHFR